MRPASAVIGLGLVLLVLAVCVVGADSCKRKRAQGNEVDAAVHVGSAQVHEARANDAEKALPEVQAKLQATQDSLDRARAEVDRLRKKVASQPQLVPGPAGAGEPVQPLPATDHRDELIASQQVLIGEQDKKITLQAEALRLALVRGDEYKAQAVDERKARMAQEAATEAWKQAVVTSRWRGRAEGFAAGLALGFVGGRR